MGGDNINRRYGNVHAVVDVCWSNFPSVHTKFRSGLHWKKSELSVSSLPHPARRSLIDRRPHQSHQVTIHIFYKVHHPCYRVWCHTNVCLQTRSSLFTIEGYINEHKKSCCVNGLSPWLYYKRHLLVCKRLYTINMLGPLLRKHM